MSLTFSSLCNKFPKKPNPESIGGFPDFPKVGSIVDGSEFSIRTPSTKKLRLEFYGRKKKYTVKYQFHVNLTDGKILELEGPFSGTSPDISIFRQKLEKKLKRWKLQVLADKGYLGSPFVISPLRKPRRSKNNPKGERPRWHRFYDLVI